MNTNSKIILGALAGAAALLAMRKKNVSGIGTVRKQPRRIWAEVEQAQKYGIDLTDPDGWKNNADTLNKMAYGKIKESASDKPMEQRYFNQLRRAYRSIAGTNLPYKENVVRNENGDVILIYRDYALDKLPQQAAEYVYDLALQNMVNDPVTSAYWATIAMIANGDVKFVWSSTKDGVHRGVEKLVFGDSAPSEKKRRISYLASPAKNGQYPEEFAHHLWERTGSRADDMEITNGVLEALQEIDTRGAAVEYCKNEYLNAHQVEEPLLYQDVPF